MIYRNGKVSDVQTVSYTHLDVYKRQDDRRDKRRFRGKGHRSDTEECRELVWNKIGMGKAVAKTVKEVVLAAAFDFPEP